MSDLVCPIPAESTNNITYRVPMRGGKTIEGEQGLALPKKPNKVRRLATFATHALGYQPSIWGLLSSKNAFLVRQTKHRRHKVSSQRPEATACCSRSLMALGSFASGWTLIRRVGNVLAGRGHRPKTFLIKVIPSPLAPTLPTL